MPIYGIDPKMGQFSLVINSGWEEAALIVPENEVEASKQASEMKDEKIGEIAGLTKK